MPPLFPLGLINPILTNPRIHLSSYILEISFHFYYKIGQSGTISLAIS
jgi:hypothetical protein